MRRARDLQLQIKGPPKIESAKQKQQKQRQQERQLHQTGPVFVSHQIESNPILHRLLRKRERPQGLAGTAAQESA